MCLLHCLYCIVVAHIGWIRRSSVCSLSTAFKLLNRLDVGKQIRLLAVSPGWKNACHHNDRDLSAHSMDTTRPQNHSGRSLQLSRCPRLGLPQSLYWVLGYSKSVVVPPTLHFCSRSWLEIAHLVSCEPNWIQSEWFFFFSLCRFPIQQGALHVRKGYPELVIPSSQGWGIGLQNCALTYPLFFFSFVCNDFSLTTLRTHYHLPYPGHVVALQV